MQTQIDTVAATAYLRQQLGDGQPVPFAQIRANLPKGVSVTALNAAFDELGATGATSTSGYCWCIPAGAQPRARAAAPVASAAVPSMGGYRTETPEAYGKRIAAQWTGRAKVKASPPAPTVAHPTAAAIGNETEMEYGHHIAAHAMAHRTNERQAKIKKRDEIANQSKGRAK
jgi:hypothetical protein